MTLLSFQRRHCGYVKAGLLPGCISFSGAFIKLKFPETAFQCAIVKWNFPGRFQSDCFKTGIGADDPGFRIRESMFQPFTDHGIKGIIARVKPLSIGWIKKEERRVSFFSRLRKSAISNLTTSATNALVLFLKAISILFLELSEP